MLLSKYFLPTLKTVNETSGVNSSRLMLRAGMIRQLTSGVYSWLPLGFKVLRNVENIIRDELNKAGGQEVLLPCIQPADLWETSGRLEGEIGSEILKIKDRHEQDLVFSATAEELITSVIAGNTQSYKEFPKLLYQIGWKFRDEIRPRFGVMRAREFLMKDAYSFHTSETCALNTFETMLKCYLKAFQRMGLKAIPVAADAGTMGGNYSREMHILSDTGESTIYYSEGLGDVLNADNITLDELSRHYACEEGKHIPEKCAFPESQIKSRKSIEVGHLFYIGQKYSKIFNASVQGPDGQDISLHMGCYGMGVSRLVGAIIEAYHDKTGIKWPMNIAPFKTAIINLRVNDAGCNEVATGIYNMLQAQGMDPLYDDMKNSAGEKFANMDLIGIPVQIIIGPRGVEKGMLEIKNRISGTREEIAIDGLESYLVEKCKY